MEPLHPHEWNFANVPDSELVACCVWEYARESASIRKWHRRWVENCTNGIVGDLEIHSMGWIGEKLYDGFFGSNFPCCWQKLQDHEKPSNPKLEQFPFTPLQISGSVYSAQRLLQQAREVEQAQHEVAIGKAKNSAISYRVSIRDGGLETFMLEIDWAHFTNDEIGDAIRKLRPKDVKGPDGRGHKRSDWRAMLTRLAAMRLLRQFTANEILGSTHYRVKGAQRNRPEYRAPLAECVPILKASHFQGDSWLEPETWYQARRDALKEFRELFQFLPHNEKPCSWQTKSGTA